MSPNTFVNFFGPRVEKNTHFCYTAHGYYALTGPAKRQSACHLVPNIYNISGNTDMKWDSSSFFNISTGAD